MPESPENIDESPADSGAGGDENVDGAGDSAAGGDEKLGEPGKKALARERAAREAAEKQVKALQAKLQEIDDSKKSELQKAIERATEAEKRAAEAELKALRTKVAGEKKVPLSALTGTTEEELIAQADALIEWRQEHTPKQPEKKRTPPPPGGGFRSGATGDGSGNSDPKVRAAEALKRLRQNG